MIVKGYFIDDINNYKGDVLYIIRDTNKNIKYIGITDDIMTTLNELKEIECDNCKNYILNESYNVNAYYFKIWSINYTTFNNPLKKILDILINFSKPCCNIHEFGGDKYNSMLLSDPIFKKRKEGQKEFVVFKYGKLFLYN